MLFPHLPPLTGLAITLRFTQKAEFSLFHEMAVDAFLRHLLNIGQTYSQHLSIVTPENGRLFYREGDTYRFVVQAQGDAREIKPILQKLIIQLQQLPHSAPIKDKAVPLRDNVILHSLQDLYDGIAVSNALSLDEYTHTRACEQAESWYQTAKLDQQPLTLTWHWQSIVRLLKADHAEHTGENRFCREANDLTPHLLLKRIYETLANLCTQFGSPPTPEQTQLHHQWLADQAQHLNIQNADLFWVDTPYFSKGGETNTLGGMMGFVQLQLTPPIEPDILTLLILGQTIGIGQRRTSGFGKYRLQHPLKQQHLHLGLHPITITRAQPLTEYLTQDTLLTAAIAQTEAKPNIDEISNKTESQVRSGAGQIRKGDYQPPPLQAFTLPKSDGSQRMLAVAPLYDRILQKAAALALTPGLDALMSQASYGYRKGLSRQQVRYEIQNAYREGYHWVFESDIDDFFDAVYRPQLLNRLKALFGDDPLWPQLESWLGAEIHYKHYIVERQADHGLPQGSPLSPLLANFILDDFDSDLEAHGFKLIRFADDFIILCKSQHQAQLAAQGVKASLAQVGLQLNIDKTHIVHLKQGFKFLGYLFREDHAIEVAGDTADGRNTFAAEDAPDNLPAWLANIGENPIKSIEDEDAPKNQIGELEEQGLHLVLAGDAQILTTDNHNLIVKKDDTLTHKVSWELLHSITLIGLHSMTLPAQHQALAHKIPVHMADRSGRYLGALTSYHPAQNSYKHWFTQLQMFDRDDFNLPLAKALVNSRIHNQRTALLKRKAHRKILQPALNQLKKLQYKVTNAQKLSSLNGLEGTATRIYLQQLNHFLPEWAHFTKRTRRPPTDPFNVLLSLGYTILYSHVDSILQAAGFLTWKGLYHQQSAAHAALASDIMESYRHLVERYALYVINHNQIKEDDFREDPQPYNKTTALRLSAEARRRYVSGLLNRFNQFSTQQTLHQHLYDQAQTLKQAIHNQTPNSFQPWKQMK